MVSERIIRLRTLLNLPLGTGLLLSSPVCPENVKLYFGYWGVSSFFFFLTSSFYIHLRTLIPKNYVIAG